MFKTTLKILFGASFCFLIGNNVQARVTAIGDISTPDANGIRLQADSSNYVEFRVGTDGNLLIKTSVNNNATTTISNSLIAGDNNFVVNKTTGFVGIGKLNPSQKLDVNGTAKATTFSDGTATLTGGSLTNVKLGSLSNGIVKTTNNDGTLSVDTNTYLTANQIITLSGDVSGTGTTSVEVTVSKINGTSLAVLATGILKNTTGTGVPSIAVAGDFPTLNQNTTGSAATLTNARSLWGQSFDGSADITGNLISVGNITGSGTLTITATNGILSHVATGANAQTFSTNGSERMRIDSSGNVGINTTNPQTLLEINGTASSTNFIVSNQITLPNAPISGTDAANRDYVLSYVNASVSDIEGTGFDTNIDSLKQVSDRVGTSTNYISASVTNLFSALQDVRSTVSGNASLGMLAGTYFGVGGQSTGTSYCKQIVISGSGTRTDTNINNGSLCKNPGVYCVDGSCGGDNSPDAFSFTNQTRQTDIEVISNEVTLSGFNENLTATCSGSCIGIAKDGVWGATTSSGFISGSKIQIKMQSSINVSSNVTSSVTLGGTTSGTWTVSTISNLLPQIYLQNITSQSGRYTTAGNVVTDNNTGLMWTKYSYDSTGEDSNGSYFDNSGTVGTIIWSSAIDRCRNLVLGGYSDWRLPDKNELQSLIDVTLYNPSINTTYFPSTQSNRYWSSTTYASNTSSAWYVNFLYGDTSTSVKTGNNYVRCVR